jgi:hypothetical protein
LIIRRGQHLLRLRLLRQRTGAQRESNNDNYGVSNFAAS